MEHESSYYQRLEITRTEEKPISEDHPQYKELRENVLKNTPKHPYWGELDLEFYTYRVDSLRRNQKAGKDVVEFWTSEVEEHKNKIRAIFSNLVAIYDVALQIADEKRIDFINQELVDMFSGDPTSKNLSDYLGLTPNQLTADGIRTALKDWSIPFEFLIDALKRHHKHIQERERAAEIFLEKVKANVIVALEKANKEGWLAVVIEKIKKRFNHAHTMVMDRLNDPFSTTVAHHETTGVIGVYSEQLIDIEPKTLQKNMMHELLHDASGNALKHILSSLTVESQESGDWKNSVELVVSNKSGVSRKTLEGVRFVWLNEAITEWLTLRLSRFSNNKPDSFSNYKGSSSYTDERKELDRLFALGLEENIVLRAFFEDAQVGDGNDQPPYFTKLLERINQLEGNQHAFHRLDNKFRLDSWIQKTGIYLRDITDGVDDERDLPEDSVVCTMEVRMGEGEEAFASRRRIRIYPTKSIIPKQEFKRIKTRLDTMMRENKDVHVSFGQAREVKDGKWVVLET